MYGERSSSKVYVAVLISIVAGGLVGFTASYVVLKGQIELVRSELRAEIEANREEIGVVRNDLTDCVDELSHYITDVKDDLTRGVERNRDDIFAVRMDLTENVKNITSNIAAVRTRINDLETYLETLSSDFKSLEERFTEIESKLDFQNFQTLEELEDWLEADTTDQQDYVPDKHDCEDFAFDLMINAFKSRRIIGTATVYHHSDTLLSIRRSDGTYWQVPIICSIQPYYVFGNHAMNIAYVETEGWVLIEPQTDLVLPLDTKEL